MKKPNVLNKLNNYFAHIIWDEDVHKMFFLKRIFIYLFRVVYLVIEGLTRNKCAVWTTSLSYTTLLSLVPLLAVMFYIFQIFGGVETITGSRLFEDYVLKNLTVGAGEQVTLYLKAFSKKIHMGALGGAGIVFLILTVVSLVTTIEKAFNNIWGVQKVRPLFVRISTYWSIVTIGPLLVALSLSLTTTFKHDVLLKKIAHIQWLNETVIFILPFILSSLALFLLYLFMPNTKVKIRSALIGGIIAGCLWEGSKGLFTYSTIHILSYNKVYGTMAAFPVFLVWLYITWLIVLVGAEIAFADQHVKSYGKEKKVEGIHFAFKEYLALHLMRYLGKRFHDSKAPVSVEQVSTDMDMPVRLVSEVTYYLSEAGLLKEVSPEQETYQVAKPLEKITIQDVLNALRKRGVALEIARSEESSYLKSFMERLEKEVSQMTSSTNFLDIVKLSKKKY